VQFGAVAFCGVVIITILGAEAFDPRILWDAAGQNKHRPWKYLLARRT
jgi:paraquat-inducible protein A